MLLSRALFLFFLPFPLSIALFHHLFLSLVRFDCNLVLVVAAVPCAHHSFGVVWTFFSQLKCLRSQKKNSLVAAIK